MPVPRRVQLSSVSPAPGTTNRRSPPSRTQTIGSGPYPESFTPVRPWLNEPSDSDFDAFELQLAESSLAYFSATPPIAIEPATTAGGRSLAQLGSQLTAVPVVPWNRQFRQFLDLNYPLEPELPAVASSSAQRLACYAGPTSTTVTRQ
jgi:hypothetical protein